MGNCCQSRTQSLVRDIAASFPDPGRWFRDAFVGDRKHLVDQWFLTGFAWNAVFSTVDLQTIPKHWIRTEHATLVDVFRVCGEDALMACASHLDPHLDINAQLHLAQQLERSLAAHVVDDAQILMPQPHRIGFLTTLPLSGATLLTWGNTVYADDATAMWRNLIRSVVTKLVSYPPDHVRYLVTMRDSAII